jgi:hypothetical protein
VERRHSTVVQWRIERGIQVLIPSRYGLFDGSGQRVASLTIGRLGHIKSITVGENAYKARKGRYGLGGLSDHTQVLHPTTKEVVASCTHAGREKGIFVGEDLKLQFSTHSVPDSRKATMAVLTPAGDTIMELEFENGSSLKLKLFAAGQAVVSMPPEDDILMALCLAFWILAMIVAPGGG